MNRPARITHGHRVFAEMKYSLMGHPLAKYLGTGIHRMDVMYPGVRQRLAA
jgi:hypothetical protein